MSKFIAIGILTAVYCSVLLGGCTDEPRHTPGLSPAATATSVNTPTPEPTAAPAATPRDSPTPTSMVPWVPEMTGVETKSPPSYEVDPGFPCGPSVFPPGRQFQAFFFHWSADETILLYDHMSSIIEEDIDIIDLANNTLIRLEDLSGAEGKFSFGYYADLSPDGQKIVYTSCTHSTDYEGLSPASYRDNENLHERGTFNYELVTIQVDGSSLTRLTANGVLDHFPVWSPDGKQLAFIAGNKGKRFRTGNAYNVYTISADGTDRQIVTNGLETDVGYYPPMWSPDGKWLSFIVPDVGLALITSTVDGSQLTKLSDNVAQDVLRLPDDELRYGSRYSVQVAWAPDGQRLGFVEPHGNGSVRIYTVNRNGSGRNMVLDSSNHDFQSIYGLNWSADGSELLFVAKSLLKIGGVENRAYKVYSVHPNVRKPKTLGRLKEPGHIAWSKDRTKLAVNTRRGIYVLDILNMNTRDVAGWSDDSGYFLISN